MHIESCYHSDALFDLCYFNGEPFAIFSKPINTKESVHLNLAQYQAVFLSPVITGGDLKIEAISCIALSTFVALGKINIICAKKFVGFNCRTKTEQLSTISADKGVFQKHMEPYDHMQITSRFQLGPQEKMSGPVMEALLIAYGKIHDKEVVDVADAFSFFGLPKKPQHLHCQQDKSLN